MTAFVVPAALLAVIKSVLDCKRCYFCTGHPQHAWLFGDPEFPCMHQLLQPTLALHLKCARSLRVPPPLALQVCVLRP